MNYNSEICCLIAENDNWKEILDSKNIKIKTDGTYHIFNYGHECDFSDPIVQEARGIIIDTECCDVVCWPFRKFGNYQETYADDIAWSSTRVQDKIDGSIIKLWYDKKGGDWVYSTNGMIHAEDAAIINFEKKTFLDAIQETKEYAVLSSMENTLNKDITYIFELTGPDVQIVIQYDRPKLWCIGARNNLTGQELRPDIVLPEIDHPAEWPLNSLDDCIHAAKGLNRSWKEDGIKKEGFVVVDRNWNRIKVKSPEYIMMHHASQNKTFPFKKIIEAVRNGSLNFDSLASSYPAKEHVIRYYQWQMSELEYQADKICRYADNLKEEYGNNQKAIALAIKDNRLSSIAFTHLKTGKDAKNILDSMDISRYLKFIKEYGNEEPYQMSCNEKKYVKTDDAPVHEHKDTQERTRTNPAFDDMEI